VREGVISGEEGSDRRDPPVGEREGERIPLRVLTPGWVVGSFLFWAETFPRVHFHNFLFFASFLFLFFLFLS
jgi:hypothetical protein